jgi:hypothetical protein
VAAMTQFALVPGGRLAYDVAGAGDPPMIFVHQAVGQPPPPHVFAGRDNRIQAQATSGVRSTIAAAASSRAQRIRVTAVSG